MAPYDVSNFIAGKRIPWNLSRYRHPVTILTLKDSFSVVWRSGLSWSWTGSPFRRQRSISGRCSQRHLRFEVCCMFPSRSFCQFLLLEYAHHKVLLVADFPPYGLFNFPGPLLFDALIHSGVVTRSGSIPVVAQDISHIPRI